VPSADALPATLYGHLSGARFPAWSADALSATLHGHFTRYTEIGLLSVFPFQLNVSRHTCTLEPTQVIPTERFRDIYVELSRERRGRPWSRVQSAAEAGALILGPPTAPWDEDGAGLAEGRGLPSSTFHLNLRRSDTKYTLNTP
jgi:hypothetical protein